MNQNLAAYLRRIGFQNEIAADLKTLRQIHFLHATQIPFENIDILLGRPISLKLEELQAKLVEASRGGYCFEQNTLFYEVLKEIGFHVIRCEARVRFGIPVVMPRTHMCLLVTLEDEKYLCDVGFGGEGLFYPVSLSSPEQKQFHWQYRVQSEGNQRVLQSMRPDGWFDLYAFVPEDRYPIDFELANWYTSTHPESRFVQTLTAQIPTPEARHILRGTTYLTQTSRGEESIQIQTRKELFQLLERAFKLRFPLDTPIKINGLL